MFGDRPPALVEDDLDVLLLPGQQLQSRAQVTHVGILQLQHILQLLDHVLPQVREDAARASSSLS